MTRAKVEASVFLTAETHTVESATILWKAGPVATKGFAHIRPIRVKRPKESQFVTCSQQHFGFFAHLCLVLTCGTGHFAPVLRDAPDTGARHFLRQPEGASGPSGACSLHVEVTDGRAGLVHAREGQRLCPELLRQRCLHIEDEMIYVRHQLIHPRGLGRLQANQRRGLRVCGGVGGPSRFRWPQEQWREGSARSAVSCLLWASHLGRRRRRPNSLPRRFGAFTPSTRKGRSLVCGLGSVAPRSLVLLLVVN